MVVLIDDQVNNLLAILLGDGFYLIEGDLDEALGILVVFIELFGSDVAIFVSEAGAGAACEH